MSISLNNDKLRESLVAITLQWERVFGVAPSITRSVSEYDAARLIGHSDESYSLACINRTAVSRGYDFIFNKFRYQVKACRPSGKPGSKITKVPQAKNYDWDYLIWIMYDKNFVIQEAWQWDVTQYRTEFEEQSRLSPHDMRSGKNLL